MPAILAVNKIDLLPDKSLLMEQLAELSKLYEFAAIVPVSAVDGNGVRSDLLPELFKQCMPGGHFFESDTLTDQPGEILAREIIREKAAAAFGQGNSAWDSCRCGAHAGA